MIYVNARATYIVPSSFKFDRVALGRLLGWIPTPVCMETISTCSSYIRHVPSVLDCIIISYANDEHGVYDIPIYMDRGCCSTTTICIELGFYPHSTGSTRVT